MKFNKKYISGKFPVIVVAAIIACGFIYYHMLKTMTADKDYWMEMQRTVYATEKLVALPAQRGNILSSNGELMASSLPNYKVYLDFLAGVPKDTVDTTLYKRHLKAFNHRIDTLRECLPEIAAGMARICPAYNEQGLPTRDSAFYARFLELGLENAIRRHDARSIYIHTGDSMPSLAYRQWRSEQERKRHKEMGRGDGTYIRSISDRRFDLFDGYILNYVQHSELLQLRLFDNKNENVSGLINEDRSNRKHPFGSLASKVLGSVFGVANAEDSTGSNSASAFAEKSHKVDSVVPIYGLELAYDSLLRGKNGIELQRRVRSHTVSIVQSEPEDGYDIVSTIDVSIQDMCEDLLRQQLIAAKAEFGLVILMEVATGDVKAMVNLTCDDQDSTKYIESLDYCMGAYYEPGSTFKTASIMVALDDGVINEHSTVDIGLGSKNWYGEHMTDTSKKTQGVIDLTTIMKVSSNIGVSTLIHDNYQNDPYKFINGLRRIGICGDLGIRMKGFHQPLLQGPNENNRWSKLSIPWMATGYGVMVAPLQTATFYNAIANNGRMVRPRFARAIARDGQIVEEFPVEVINEQICSPEALRVVQHCLYEVVNGSNNPTGKNARNPYYHVSGKTGTAQALRNGAYSKTHRYTTFASYFPSEAPKYTCIVSVQGPNTGGGATCAPVVSRIAGRLYSKVETARVDEARDSLSVMVPDVKTGNTGASQLVLDWLKVPHTGGTSGNYTSSAIDGSQIRMTDCPVCDLNTMPDLTGMGARDAIYTIESRGMTARISGMGKVKKQSLAPGSEVVRGKIVTIELAP